MLRNNLMLPTEALALDIPEAIDFDGTNDYLSRSSDLVGNTDGKTFTFSAWVWRNFTTGTKFIYTTDNVTDARVQIYISDTAVGLFMKNSSGTVILNASATINLRDTFINILWSVDLASTSNRSLYINDVLQTATWTTYTNANIDFTQPNHNIGGGPTLGEYIGGRLSNVYLDYTYRNLSVEANRRLFITADRKPALNQQALNPILYLPLNDPTQPGKNLGTGGDFNLTGVVARSGRGPNQFNAPYSDLDGAADYLSRTTALVGVADGKQVTVSFVGNLDLNVGYVLEIRDNTTLRFRITLEVFGVNVYGYNSSGSIILNIGTTEAMVQGRNYHVAVSIDLTDTNKRFIFVNGQQKAISASTYTNGNIDLAPATPLTRIGIGEAYFNGRLGNVFFDTRYIDLSVPANLAKFVTGTGIDAKPVDLGANGELPFGTPPLIYLPMYGNNPGKNYGTGGDFTVFT